MKYPGEKGRGPKRRDTGERIWFGLAAAVTLAASVLLQYGWEQDGDFLFFKSLLKQEETEAAVAMAPVEENEREKVPVREGSVGEKADKSPKSSDGVRPGEVAEALECGAESSEAKDSAAGSTEDTEKSTEGKTPDVSEAEEPEPPAEGGALSEGESRTGDEPEDSGEDGDTGGTQETENSDDVGAGQEAAPEQTQRQYAVSDSLFQRIYGKSYKADCTVPREDLRYIRVLYYDFSGNRRYGELISNKAISQDLVEIFKELYNHEYRIEKIRLVDDYDADDDWSSSENNTSCFNFRTVAGKSSLSLHARGLAIDINPKYNPNVFYDGEGNVTGCFPANGIGYADRSQDFPHKIDENDLCVRLFLQHGFTWGGNWTREPDYMHFSRSAVPET